MADDAAVAARCAVLVAAGALWVRQREDGRRARLAMDASFQRLRQRLDDDSQRLRQRLDDDSQQAARHAVVAWYGAQLAAGAFDEGEPSTSSSTEDGDEDMEEVQCTGVQIDRNYIPGISPDSQRDLRTSVQVEDGVSVGPRCGGPLQNGQPSPSAATAGTLLASEPTIGELTRWRGR